MTAQLLAAALGLTVALAAVDLFRDETADYTAQREFVSPISGLHFVADVLVRQPRVQSWDHDRCPHSAVNTFAYQLVIDPATGYVESPDRFALPAPWGADEVREIVGEPRFSRNTPEGLPWAGAYAWEKFENAARLAEAAGRPKTELGNYWLLAGWSVRLDFALGPGEFRAQVEEILSHMPRVTPEPGGLNTIYELELADYWAELDAAGELTGQPRSAAALAIAWLYRSRGELADAEHWLAVAAEEDPLLAGAPGGVYAHLRSSIKLEGDYLRSARRLLSEAWTGGAVAVANEGGAAFLIAEIDRRLGEYAEAVRWYDLALANHRGAIARDLIERQRRAAVDRQGL